MRAQRPHVRPHAAAVIVDHDVGQLAVAGHVDLADDAARQRVDERTAVRERIGHARVQRVDDDVVDVEQHPAAAARAELREELGLGDRVVGERDIRRQVLDQHRPAQPILHLRHMPRHQRERRLGERDRQQVVHVHDRAVRSDAREARVIGDAHRIDPLDQARQTIQMPRIEPGGRAEREPDAMQADGILLARLAQHRERGATVGKEVLGMDLDEAERRPQIQQLGIVWLAQADACTNACRDHAHFFIAALASSAVLPPIFAQVPFAT